MNKITQKLLTSLILVGSIFTATADDIDIISKEVAIKTNVLFVMDLSNSMNAPTNAGPSRLEALSGAFQDIVNDPAFEKINIGLSVFSGGAQSGQGASVAHGVMYPVAPVTDANPTAVPHIDVSPQNILNRNPLFTHKGISFMPAANTTTETHEYLSLLSSDNTIWDAGGNTPLVDALYEGALYFRGGDVAWGRFTPDHISAAHPSTYTGELENTLVPVACVSTPGPGYNRVECEKGVSCGTTPPLCTINTRYETRSIDTGGCTPIISQMTCNIGDTSCGLGTNCGNYFEDKYCDVSHSSITSCQSANPTWVQCSTYTEKYNYRQDPFGEGDIFDTRIRVKCKEERTYCDVDAFRCPVQEEVCTKCPEASAQVTGSAIYKSPIIEKCPANGIVLLSDGEPTVNLSANLVENMVGTGYANGCTAGSDPGRCGPELAKFLANEDHSSIAGNQTVRTFTVGLDLSAGTPGAAYLQSIADNGDGSFVNATNRADLATAFKQAIFAIGKRERSFSSPSYTVNTSTQLTHGKYVYVPMFDRETGVAWPGNLKKYELKADGKLYGKDATTGLSAVATDESGRLNSGVLDLWATSTVGGVIEGGGAAHKLPAPATRKMYTDIGGSLNELKVSNSAVLSGVSGRADLIKFIRGEKSDGTQRFHMGDIIHSKPLQLAYSSTESVIFVGTNEGLLHAINADTGVEIYSFMPQELLANIKPQYDNPVMTEHLYGVDGPMKLWLDDTNNNGVKDSGEDAYLYFGLRRGGGSYYALKLGNSLTDTPRIQWKINNSTTGFSDLGYTWSEPTMAKLKYTNAGTSKPVLVFGGGYVDDHNGVAANNGAGSAVYIVDAITGDKVWSSSLMDFAVPAKVRTVDVDRNGSVDRLYFGDTGGNIWRVDLGDKTARWDMSQSTVRKFAQLGNESMTNDANDRKFFTEPDVAFLKHRGRYVLSVSIGTGSRPDPLNRTVENFFYVLFDKDVFKTPTTSMTITKSDLATAPVTTGDIISKLNQANSKKGWEMQLNDNSRGEKVLSSALTFENKIMFSSLHIKEVTTVNYNNNVCSLNNNNEGRLYVLDLLTGKAVMDLDSNTASTTDKYVSVAGGEILETPQIVYGDFTNKTGGQCTDNDCSRSYSIHAGKGPAIAGSKTPTIMKIPAWKKLPRAYWMNKEK